MMSEAEALRTGYAMLDDHNDEEGEEPEDEWDGFTIEDEDGYVIGPGEDEQDPFVIFNNAIEEEDMFTLFGADDIDIYDDGPESTAEPEGW